MRSSERYSLFVATAAAARRPSPSVAATGDLGGAVADLQQLLDQHLIARRDVGDLDLRSFTWDRTDGRLVRPLSMRSSRSRMAGVDVDQRAALLRVQLGGARRPALLASPNAVFGAAGPARRRRRGACTAERALVLQARRPGSPDSLTSWDRIRVSVGVGDRIEVVQQTVGPDDQRRQSGGIMIRPSLAQIGMSRSRPNGRRRRERKPRGWPPALLPGRLLTSPPSYRHAKG